MLTAGLCGVITGALGMLGSLVFAARGKVRHSTMAFGIGTAVFLMGAGLLLAA